MKRKQFKVLAVKLGHSIQELENKGASQPLHIPHAFTSFESKYRRITST